MKDCTNVFDFIKCFKKFCEDRIATLGDLTSTCKTCPLQDLCDSPTVIPENKLQEAITTLQKWELANAKSYKDIFFEKFPNAPTDESGSPKVCAMDVFKGISCYESFSDCAECWNSLYDEDKN